MKQYPEEIGRVLPSAPAGAANAAVQGMLPQGVKRLGHNGFGGRTDTDKAEREVRQPW